MIKVWGSSLLAASVLLFAGSAFAQDACASTDLNGDGATDPADVEVFQSTLGSQDGDDNYLAAADFDGDGAVTAADYGIFLACN